MSGVEIVGFVLAALPLVISAVEHYHDGLDPLKDYLRYNSTLKSLRTRLRIQQDLFEGTLKRLLLEELSTAQAQALFPDASQHADREQWNRPEIKEKIRNRLGGKYENFMDVVCEMETAMRRLMKNLDIDIKERVGTLLTSNYTADNFAAAKLECSRLHTLFTRSREGGMGMAKNKAELYTQAQGNPHARLREIQWGYCQIC